jgi:ABC-type tungstate transport system permease subunit
MGQALNTAGGMDAYILSNRASLLSFRNKGLLVVAAEPAPDQPL